MDRKMTFRWFLFFAAVIAAITLLAWQYPTVRGAVVSATLILWLASAVVLAVNEVRAVYKDNAEWLRAIRAPGYPDPGENLHRIANELFPSGAVRDGINGRLEGMDREALARLRQAIAREYLRRTGLQVSVLPKRPNRRVHFMDVDRYALGVLAPPTDKSEA